MHSKVRIISAVFILVLVLATSCCLRAQGIDQQPKFNKKVGVGVIDHDDGRLFTGLFEFRILPHFTLEPSVGFTRYSRNDFEFAFNQKVVFTKFSMGLDAKRYFLLNRRYPLEGIFAAAHGSFFRFNTYATKDDYRPLKMYHSKAGLGIGGNYYVFKRVSLGATLYVCYTRGADILMNQDGTTRRIHYRSGFVLPYTFQVGFTF